MTRSLKCVACGEWIPEPTDDPFRCPRCRAESPDARADLRHELDRLAGREGGIQQAVVRCEDCGLPYADFPLDMTVPDDQWARLMPGRGEGGILCAQCIVKRASTLPGVVAVRARIAFADGANDDAELRERIRELEQEVDRQRARADLAEEHHRALLRHALEELDRRGKRDRLILAAVEREVAALRRARRVSAKRGKVRQALRDRALTDYMGADTPTERDAAFLRVYATHVLNGTAATFEISNTVAKTLEDIAGRMQGRILDLEQENAELRERDRTLSHQLERRADGMDPLTQALRARVADLEQWVERLEALANTKGEAR